MESNRIYSGKKQNYYKKVGKFIRWKIIGVWGRKWKNLIQRMAEFRGWKTVDLWHRELGVVIEGYT